MSIFIGNIEINSGKLKIGSNDIQEVYVGSTKIWQANIPDNTIDISTFNVNAVTKPTNQLDISTFNVNAVTKPTNQLDISTFNVSEVKPVTDYPTT